MKIQRGGAQKETVKPFILVLKYILDIIISDLHNNITYKMLWPRSCSFPPPHWKIKNPPGVLPRFSVSTILRAGYSGLCGGLEQPPFQISIYFSRKISRSFSRQIGNVIFVFLKVLIFRMKIKKNLEKTWKHRQL